MKQVTAMTAWRIQLRYTGPPHTLTKAETERLADELGQYSHNAHSGRLTVWKTVDASNPMDAFQRAYTTTVTALKNSGIDGIELAAANIETEEEAEGQLRSPDPVTVADTTIAAEILSVSRQRAGVLMNPDSDRRDPHAPLPFTTTRNGPLWRREAVELYAMERDPSQNPWKNRTTSVPSQPARSTEQPSAARQP